MSRFEIISQTHGGDTREVDGQIQRPLKINGVALATHLTRDHYPLPLFSLSGAVERNQPDLHEITLARAQNADEIIASINTNIPDVVALSAPQGTLETLDQTLESLNKFPPEKRPQILLGGSLPTYLSDRFFKKYPDLPLIIVGGWGEDIFADEVRRYSIENPEPNQKFIIGKYPEYYPKQDGIPTKGTVAFNFIRVEASKGCFWDACSYCLRPLNEKQGKWKQYKPKDVLKQITDLLELGYTGYFEFADEEPVGTDIVRFQGIMDELIELKKEYPTFTFGMNMRADHVISPEPGKQEQYDNFLRSAKKAGLTNVWMGAESYSRPHLQKTLHKGSYITPQTNLDAAKKIDGTGINLSQGFIPYHPLSNWQELLEMAHFMEPHAPFLSRVLSAPFGFLRVQLNTPYEKTIRKLESSTNDKLLGELDEDMLTYQCRYQDSSIGIHAAYMRLFYDWINPYVKQMNYEAAKGDGSRSRLDQLRSIGLQLFLTSIKQLEPLKDDLGELEGRQISILDKYKEEIRDLGINTAEFDEAIQHHLSDYLGRFI